MKNVFFFTCVLWITCTFSQESNLLEKIIDKNNKINDYSVDAVIKAEVPMIKMKEVSAVFYYMKKDKFKIKTDGIAVLPKQGISELMKFISKKDYMAIESDGKLLQGVKTTQVTLIPEKEEEDIVLCKVWVDPIRQVILQSQTTTKSAGTVTVYYTYKDQGNFGLPSKLIFEIDVKKFKMPKSVAANIHSTKSNSENKGGKGKISVSLSNYQINKGKGVAAFK